MESAVILPPDYRPSADEEYMNEMQLEYFRQNFLTGKIFDRTIQRHFG